MSPRLWARLARLSFITTFSFVVTMSPARGASSVTSTFLYSWGRGFNSHQLCTLTSLRLCELQPPLYARASLRSRELLLYVRTLGITVWARFGTGEQLFCAARLGGVSRKGMLSFYLILGIYAARTIARLLARFALLNQASAHLYLWALHLLSR
jgi:nucleoside recognition membrane protein YjiH